MFVKNISFRFYHLQKNAYLTRNANDLVSQIDTRMKNTYVWIFLMYLGFKSGFIIQISYLGILALKALHIYLLSMNGNDLPYSREY